MTEIYFLACSVCHNVTRRPWCQNVVWKILFSCKAIVLYLAWIPQLLHIICDRLWKGRICLCLLVGILWPSQKDLSLGQCKQIIIRHVLLPFLTFSCVNTTFIFSFRRVVCVSVVSELTYCLRYGSLAVTRARWPGVALLVALNNFVLYRIVPKAIRLYIYIYIIDITRVSWYCPRSPFVKELKI